MDGQFYSLSIFMRKSAFLQTRLHFNPVGLDLVVKGLAADAEAFGGFELVPAGFLEGLDDGVTFHTFEQGETRVGAVGRADFGVGDRKIGNVHFVPFVQEDGPLDFILQLSNVARPVKGGEPLNRCRREAINNVIGLRGEPFQK